MNRTFDQPIISVAGLSKSYGGRLVVDQVSFTVYSGEVVGIIGSNGAGKTTTVECLQGLTRPDAGDISVLGCDPIRNAIELRPLIGSQLQDSALPDRIKVSEAVELFSGPRAVGADELLERFGLAHKRRVAFANMSGGERQRLFLVLALLNQPRLVILDELTQGLDPAARREVWSSVNQLRDAGTTVLLVTHELEEAEALCDRIIAMKDGKVLDSGRPSELIARHAGWASIRFTGQPASIAQLQLLPGVEHVDNVGGITTVRGANTVIAHVGHWLITHDELPTDIHVHSPDLESALLQLLEGSLNQLPKQPTLTGATQ